MNGLSDQLKLCLVIGSQPTNGLGLLDTVEAAIRGGVSMVQLRMKHTSTEHRIEVGRQLQPLLRAAAVPLIINNDVEAAVALNADGVHVGQQDMPADQARARLGDDRIVGLSINHLSQLRAVDPRVVDYAGLGPVYATTSKPDHAAPIGVDGLAALVQACPIAHIAIGGINDTNAGAIAATGVGGIAVISAICGAPDPCHAAQNLRSAYDS